MFIHWICKISIPKPEIEINQPNNNQVVSSHWFRAIFWMSFFFFSSFSFQTLGGNDDVMESILCDVISGEGDEIGRLKAFQYCRVSTTISLHEHTDGLLKIPRRRGKNGTRRRRWGLDFSILIWFNANIFDTSSFRAVSEQFFFSDQFVR